MQQEDIEQKLSYSQKYQLFKQQVLDVPILPLPKKKLDIYISNNPKSQKAEFEDQLTRLNKQAIQEKFVAMMEIIFTAIEPELTQYRKYRSTEYLDSLIIQKLDRQIYHKGYKLHKEKQTPMLNLLQNRQVDFANRLFTQLFDIMNELLTTMKIYYGYQNDQSISEALYQAIGRFIEKNEESIILKEDRLSMAFQEKQRQEQKQKQSQGTSSYQFIVDVLEAASKEQSGGGLIDKAGKFVGVFYKYGISPAVDTVYQAIKSINPIAKTTKISAEQEQKLKMDLITHLLPHLSVKQPLQEKLVTFLIKLIPMTIDEILKTMGTDQIQNFTNLISQVLNDFQNPSFTFKKIVQELMLLLNQAMSSQSESSDEFYSDFQQGKWIILLYKTLQQNYNPERRRLLLEICRYPEINRKLINPVGIIKLVQSQNLLESDLLGKIRSLSVSKNSESPEEIIARKEQDKEVLNAIEHQLHRIHLYELKKKYKQQPLLQFQRLTNHSAKRTITFLFSGFMSQDTCKVDEWEGILDSIYDSEIYSVRWESKSYGDLFDFAVQTGKDIAKANLSIGILGQIGGPYLRAVAIIRQLYKKYHSNPFNPAFESAQITGYFLAEMIISSFQSHFINLVGFSLGAELIKNILKRLAKRKHLHMINKVYIMGGITDKKQFQDLLEKAEVPLNILNLHSNNDSTLKYFLKMCKPNIEPIGLYPLREDIHGQLIQNHDCTNFIDGHLDYRKNLKILDKLMNIKDD